MMRDPREYAKQFENASYSSILKIKNELVSGIKGFENDKEKTGLKWNVSPGPDVMYQWNLEVLGLIAPMVAEAFRREGE